MISLIEQRIGLNTVNMHLLIGSFKELCVAAGALTLLAALLLWSDDVVDDYALGALGGIR